MKESPNFLTNPGAKSIPEHVSPPTPAPAPKTPKPVSRQKKRIGCLSLLLIVFVLLLVLSPLIYGGARAGRGALMVKDSLELMRAHLEAREFDEALVSIEDAEDGLGEVRAGLRSTGPWRAFPYVGSRLRALEEVEQAGRTAISGAKELIGVANTIMLALEGEGIVDPTAAVGAQRSFQDLTKEEKRTILAQLQRSLPAMQRARERIDIAAEAWERIPKERLFAPALAALEPVVAQLPVIRKQIDDAVSLIEIILPLAGYPEERTYLMLLQNADELRPGGGFIGNVGEVRVEAADFEQIEFKDVYAVDDPVADTWDEVPPEPIREHLRVPAWFLRDANWSPDFPTSARTVMDFYERETLEGTGRSVRLDSVIALEPTFFEDLLRLTGPVTVEGKTFNADNFFDQLQYDVEIGFLGEGIPVPQRKEVVAKVGDELLTKLTSQPASRWPDIASTVTKALERKDMMIYSRDTELQDILDMRDWSGRVEGSDGDYLMVVDANLAALKTDGQMNKRIFYSVDLSDVNNPTATVRLRYTNNTQQIDWRYTRYRSYTRIYVPEGSQLISSSGAMAGDLTQTGRVFVPGEVDVTRDLGKTVFGAFWAIEPRQTGELTFTYRLPDRVADQIMTENYDLLVQKQPGAETELTLDLSLGKKLRQATPPEEPSAFGDDRYEATFDIVRDTPVTVSF